jgi:two-component system chemotaxis sensor kinase CheA
LKTDRSIKDFLAEAEDILETANQTMISLEAEQAAGHSAPDLVNALFRAIHSFKGLAGMFGLKVTSDLSHKLEYLLDEIRLGKTALSRDALDVLFETVALLGRHVQQASTKEQPEDIAVAFEGIIKAKPSIAVNRSLLDQIEIDRGLLQVLTEYEEYRLKENIRERKNLFTMKASFELADFEKGIKYLNEVLKKNAEIICTLPTAASAAGGGIGFTIVAGSAMGRAELMSAVNMPNVSFDAVPYVEGRKAEEPRSESGALKSVSNTVRVDI